MGRSEEAISQAKRALELDPLSLSISTSLAHCFYFARQYDKAIKQFKKTLELDGNFVPAHGIALPYEQKGMYEEAIGEWQTLARLLGNDSEVLAGLGHAYGMSGKRDKAQKVLDELKELSKRRYVQSFHLAIIYLGLGEKDQTFQLLDKAYEQRDEELVLIKVDPRLDPLRSDSRYADLVRRMGFPKS
jgi:tetratricopeptide (TPR) repeat protein